MEKPEIPRVYLDLRESRLYRGPIEPGIVFAWELDLPHARELCIVVRLGPPPPPEIIDVPGARGYMGCGAEEVVWTRPPDVRELARLGLPGYGPRIPGTTRGTRDQLQRTRRGLLMKRLSIIPRGWLCTLRECPPGHFTHGDNLCFKSEYRNTNGDPEAYCESGEYFYGGAADRAAAGNIVVQPAEAVWEVEE